MSRVDYQSAVQSFWQVSCEFYSDEGIKKRLLTLQNQQGKNVNQLLFALWVSEFFNYRFDSSSVDAVLRSAWRCRKWVNKVRRLRLEFKSDKWLKKPLVTEQLAQAILQSELELEKLHQSCLVHGLLDFEPHLNRRNTRREGSKGEQTGGEQTEREQTVNESEPENSITTDIASLMHQNLIMLNGESDSDDYAFLVVEWQKLPLEDRLSANNSW